MSGQGAQDAGEQRDWWAQLYDPHAADTGRAGARDTLDERYRSVSRTLTGPPTDPPGPGRADPAAAGAPPGPESAAAPVSALPAGVLPPAAPDAPGEWVPETVLESARYGSAELHAVSVRGAAGRREGRPRTDALLAARFGAEEDGLLLVAVAAGGRSGPGGHRAAREACHAVGEAVGRSSARLARDLREDRTSALQPGLHRLTDRAFGRLRAQAAALGLEPERHTVDLRCLLLPADPRCSTRVLFGAGAGGAFRRSGDGWQDIEPVGIHAPPPPDTPAGRDPTAGAAAARDGFAPAERTAEAAAAPFHFRSRTAEPGDVLLLCGPGVAEPLRAEPAFGERLATRWTGADGGPPGAAAYLDGLLCALEGHSGDRTAVTVWES
ncbi:protein phosphatase 2C domain-containing protein [Streptomyces sp. NPDC006990]|uniref:protein phosphatase 2C domain-containing protein n=1 Tax=Streptomyces sp. NPDC006990 TaxID=3154481 RepID=UPI003453C0D4